MENSKIKSYLLLYYCAISLCYEVRIPILKMNSDMNSEMIFEFFSECISEFISEIALPCFRIKQIYLSVFLVKADDFFNKFLFPLVIP